MPVEVNGHPLEFDAVVNVDDALNGILQLTQAFEGALKTKSDTTALDILKTKLSELRKQAEDFQSQLSKGGDAESVKNLGDHLAATNTQIKVVQQLLDSLSPEGPKKVTDELVKQNDQSLRLMAQLRLLKQELASMEQHGLGGTAQFDTKLKEAVELEGALRNVNQQLELQSNRAGGVEALSQAFRGLVGGVEGVAGIASLLTNDESKAEELTKNLIGIQSVLEGFSEFGRLFNRESPVNVELRRVIQNLGLVTTAKKVDTAATEAMTAAEGESIAVTEGATAAQTGLNAAMLANPVAILLGSIVALFGAYEIYAHTLGKATDAERQHQAAEEALEEARKRSTDTIAEEEAELTSLVALSKNENLTREQRLEKIAELQQKYPEYLSNIGLEDVYTSRTNEAISEQITLLKARALAQAAESVYADKLKTVVEKQNELNRVMETGGTFWEKFLATTTNENLFKPGTSEQEDLIKIKMDDLKAATDDANGAFDNFISQQTNLAQATQTSGDAIDILRGKMQQLKEAGLFSSENAKLFKDFADQLSVFLKPQGTQTLDPKVYDAEIALLKAQYAKRIAAAKQGSDEQLQIERELQNKLQEMQKEDSRLFTPEGFEKGNNKQSQTDLLNQQAEFLQQMQTLNNQITQKALSNAAAAAQSVVISLQAIGQAGSAAYFDAQEAAFRKGAAQQRQAAGDNAGVIRQITAQLNLDLHNLDLARQKQSLEDEKSRLQVQLDAARQGSQQELDLRLSLIDIAAKEELLQAGKNADKITEVSANAAKKKQDIIKQFAIETAETETNIQLSQINTQLANAAHGTAEEVQLKKQQVDLEAQLAIEGAQKQIKNEQLLAAKIAEIYGGALASKKKLDDEYYATLFQNQIKILDADKNRAVNQASNVTNDPFASDQKKFAANVKALQQSLNDINLQIGFTEHNIRYNQGNIDDLETKLEEFKANKDKVLSDLALLNSQNASNQISKYAAEIAAVGSAFKSLSSQLTTLNPQLAAFFNQMGQIASTASSIATAAAKGFTDPAADIQAASSMIDTVVNIFVSAATAAKQAKQSVIDFYDAISAGELKTSEDARAAARQRAQQNEKDLKGLKDEFTLLQQQQKDNADQYNKILQQIYQQSFVASTKANTGIFGLPAFINGGASKNTIQELASLAGKSYSDLLDLYNKGQLTDKAKTLFEQLKALSDEGQNIQDALASLQDKLNQTLTGTTSQTIADSIKQGLEQGKRSVADFADSFNQLISQAILSSFEANQIQPAIAEFYKKFAQLSQQSGGNLTQDQITQLRNLYNTDINSFVQQIQQLQQISGTGLSTGLGPDASSLSGAIKGMSEQTAELIAGQFGGLRLTAIDQLNIARQTLDLQSDIQANTANTVSRLDKMIANMDYYFLQKGIKIQ